MKGEVVYLYAFDVANEIALAGLRDNLLNESVPFELPVDHTLPKDLPIYKPLAIEHPVLTAACQKLQVRPLIHIYEIGVISIVMRTSFDVTHLNELLPFHNLKLMNGQSLAEAALELCDNTCKRIQSALIQSSKLVEPEAYTVFCITEIDHVEDLNDWFNQNQTAIAHLLTESQPSTLSPMQINEVLRIHLSYAQTDFTIIDWDAALVVDRTRYVEDVLYVLELANLQLEEYRVLDQRLDRYLNKAYDDIQQHKSWLFGAYTSVLRTLRSLRIDMTKLNDEITHITKFFGDWYLSRVYLGACERFHLSEWRNSVAERLKQIDAIYSVAHDEITNKRMFWLELIIVVFFAIDLIGLYIIGR